MLYYLIATFLSLHIIGRLILIYPGFFCTNATTTVRYKKGVKNHHFIGQFLRYAIMLIQVDMGRLGCHQTTIIKLSDRFYETWCTHSPDHLPVEHLWTPSPTGTPTEKSSSTGSSIATRLEKDFILSSHSAAYLLYAAALYGVLSC